MNKRYLNVQSGIETITLTSGSGTKTVSLDNVFKNASDYSVQLTLQQDLVPSAGGEPRLYITNKTNSSFDIGVASDSASATVNVAYLVIRNV